ncbi:MAG: lytic transglycosylase domain-containing protein [Beijerinckiaceae bacterium]
MASFALPVHAQSQKREDRVPPLPAAIAIDAEGVARDAREAPAAAVPTLPDVERPDLPQPTRSDTTPPSPGPSVAEREALSAAARRRHPERSRAEVEAMVRRIAAELTFDAAFAATIARIESGFDPFAVSEKGAIGVMQLMPAVIQDQRAQDPRLADPFDPEANIRAGVRHLKALGQELRHPVLVASAYHSGVEAVRAARGIPNGPRTAEYIVAVLNGFYDLMAITETETGAPVAARPAGARGAAPNRSTGAAARNTIRTARAEAAAPSNPTGIWERGFVLHLD